MNHRLLWTHQCIVHLCMIVWFVTSLLAALKSHMEESQAIAIVNLAMFFLLGWLAGQRLNCSWNSLHLKFVDSDSWKFKFNFTIRKMQKIQYHETKS